MGKCVTINVEKTQTQPKPPTTNISQYAPLIIVGSVVLAIALLRR